MTPVAHPDTITLPPEAQSPKAIHHEQPTHAPSQAVSKRRTSNSGSKDKQPRARRGRYVNRACTTCAQRKLRCDGQMPCERCVAGGHECSYQSSAMSLPPACDNSLTLAWSKVESLSAEILALRQQLDAPQQTMARQAPPSVHPFRHSSIAPPAPSARLPALVINSDPTNEATSVLPRSLSSAPDHSHPCFLTPPGSFENVATPRKEAASSSSSALHNAPPTSQFAFHVAKQGFDPLGMQSSPSWEPNIQPTRCGSKALEALLVKDPLWRLDGAKVEQCLEVWHNGWGAMVPLVSVAWTQSTWASIRFSLDAAKRDPASATNTLAAVDVLLKPDAAVLKMILSNAMALEANEGFEIACKLYEGLAEARDDALWGCPSLENVVLLTLVALFKFHMSDQLGGSRVVAVAARLCLELGLHSGDSLQKTIAGISGGNRNAMLDPVVIFWCVFVTERRLSTYVGTPFTLQESDIDDSLPQPPASHVYLNAMVTSAALLGTAARQVTRLRNLDLPVRVADIDYQDYQWLQWAKGLPQLDMTVLQIEDPHSTVTADQASPFISAVLQARSHQLRGLIFRPMLYSPSRIQSNIRQARTAATIAKETVTFLAMLNRETSFARNHALFYQDLLIEAFISILLAAINAPGEFNRLLEAEFYMALDILRSLQSQSPSRPHLWETVQHFEAMGPAIGLVRSNLDSVAVAPDLQSHVAEAPSPPLYVEDVISSSVIPSADHSMKTSNDSNSGVMDDIWTADSNVRPTYPMSLLSAMCRDEFTLLTDANESVARLLVDWDTL